MTPAAGPGRAMSRFLRQPCGLRIGTGLLVLLMVSCTRSPDGGPRSAHGVRYVLTWKADGSMAQAGSTSRTLVNDRGYTIRLTRGYLVTRSMELVECPKTVSAGWIESPLALLLHPQPAYAGHSIGTPNPAAITTPHVESLLDVASSTAGSVSLAAQHYCQVHYLIARADTTTVNLPHDVDMVDASLHLEGFSRSPTAPEEQPFVLRTTAANGTLVDLFPPGHYGDPQAKFRLDTGTQGAEVIFRRNLDRLFDGVEFAGMTDRLKVQQVLKNAIDTMEVEVNRRSDL
jgi:hypothetical protein